jgi:hypothetical protein
MKAGLRVHLALCVFPLTTFECLLERRRALRRERLENSRARPNPRVTECLVETNSPKEGAVGEQQSETQPTGNRLPSRDEQP